MTDENFSLESIQWLDWMQNQNLLVNENGRRSKLFSSWNSKEISFGNYRVDGWAIVDGCQIIFEYRGCHVHFCQKCNRDKILRKNERERKKFFSSFKNTRMVEIQSCEWQKLSLKNKYVSKVSCLMQKNVIRSEDLVKLLAQNKLFGFALVDLDLASTSYREKFLKINWLPIIQKTTIEFEDLSPWMRARMNPKDFPREKQIVQGLKASKILIHTELLALYTRLGFNVKKVHKLFEYEASACFKEVYDKTYSARVKATIEKNVFKATAIKLVSNSMFGATLLVICVPILLYLIEI